MALKRIRSLFNESGTSIVVFWTKKLKNGDPRQQKEVHSARVSGGAESEALTHAAPHGYCHEGWPFLIGWF